MMEPFDIDPHLLNLIVGISYVVIFGVMAILRREGISSQFLLEGLVLTCAVTAGGYLSGSHANPLLFLMFLYIVTMRSRLLVDLASFLSSRGRQRDAISTLQVSLRLWPDDSTRRIALVNMGIVQLRRENPESAKQLLEEALKEDARGGLSLRHQAAAHFNLGLAYRRIGQEGKAAHHFETATNIMPGSPYGKAAEKALKQRREKKSKEN